MGLSLYARLLASSTQATLLGLGVHRQRMFPLGVAKWHGEVELCGPLHAKRAATAGDAGRACKAPLLAASAEAPSW